MSAPFGVHMTVISGQQHSREIVVAASTFLSMNYLAIQPVANHGKIREQFLKALQVFATREKLYFRESPGYYAERLVEPRDDLSTGNFFWLALDSAGETLARNIFQSHGELPDRRAHQSVNKLNLIESPVGPPPQADVSLQSWSEFHKRLYALVSDYRKLKPNEPRRTYMDRQITATPDQELYDAWFQSLYTSLVPWRQAIEKIQSDLS